MNRDAVFTQTLQQNRILIWREVQNTETYCKFLYFVLALYTIQCLLYCCPWALYGRMTYATKFIIGLRDNRFDY